MSDTSSSDLASTTNKCKMHIDKKSFYKNQQDVVNIRALNILKLIQLHPKAVLYITTTIVYI